MNTNTNRMTFTLPQIFSQEKLRNNQEYTPVEEAIDLERLLDHILQAPVGHLPTRQEAFGHGAASQSPSEFAQAFLERHLKELCQRVEVSGILRRRATLWQIPPGSALDFVAVPQGYTGTLESLQETPFLGFLRCYQLLCRGGGVPLRPRFSTALGLPYYSFISLHGPMRIWVTTQASFGIALLLTTGPRSHLVQLSLQARCCGHCPLLPEGLHTATHELLCAEEEEIYHALGMEKVPANKR